ncbi:TPA: hypothetical protein N0F65_001896 [Lagenidium giganteum]|uniref:Aminomethyltransferase folate-binding domain-containing protein n=1 Tax=Lagenidium giganteum TaxID=4803 RepID=A0AAV2Z4M4_9STRA|nr:TPA: hypothetical protein N0F65_001896 [Lagenidium giganteum]
MATSLLCRSGFTQLRSRKLLQVQGVDAARFLQGILTNDMKALNAPQKAMYGGFLTTKGRLLGDCNVISVKDDVFYLDYDASVEEDLLKHWKRYKLRLKVKLEDRSADFKTYSTLPALIDNDSHAMISDAADATELAALNGAIEPEEGAIFADPRGDVFGSRVIISSSRQLKVPEHYEELDGAAYSDRRVFLGAAEGKELSDGIPLESNLELLHGVSFRKGCYVGQELTARTQFKGNIRKRFVPVALVPSEHQDVVKALANVSFNRLDAGSHEALRDFFASAAPNNLSTVAEGTKIMKEGSSKAVGTILGVGKDVSSALAMMRLEHLYPKEDGEEAPVVSFSTADGNYLAVPYQPSWWPSLDPKTGKMTL